MAEGESGFENLFESGANFLSRGMFLRKPIFTTGKSEADLYEAAKGVPGASLEYGLENIKIGFLPARTGLETHQPCSNAKHKC